MDSLEHRRHYQLKDGSTVWFYRWDGMYAHIDRGLWYWPELLRQLDPEPLTQTVPTPCQRPRT
jgi:hypothetical protein